MATKKTTDQGADVPDEEVSQPEVEQIEEAKTLVPDVSLPAVRRIRVVRVFQGARTGEEKIETGRYADDDPLLFGLAQYLIDNQYAEIDG